MNRTTVVLIAFAASACALHQAPKENEPLDIDMAGFVGTVGGKDAARRIEFELKLLAQPPDEHTRTHFILPGPKGRAQLRAMLLVDLERAISELTAKSAADPLAVVEPYTRINLNIARRGAVAYAPDRAAVIDELIERAAKVHDERAAAVGVGRPAAYRFHIARAMLIRGAGSLPDASNLIAPRVALRVTVEGKKCPSFAASLAKMMTSTFESKRTVEASVTLERCSVRFNESKREEALNWEEKVDGGKEHVTVRHRELCPLGRDEQDRVWCRVTETAEKELCPPQAYTRCYTQTLETVERQVVKTVAGYDLSEAKFMNVPNKTIKIELVADGKNIQFLRDGEVIFTFEDPEPLREGWFGFRTTRSHICFDNFKVTRIPAQGEKK